MREHFRVQDPPLGCLRHWSMRLVVLVYVLVTVRVLPAAPAELHLAEQDVLQGKVDQAIAELRTLSGADTGPAHLLLCRAYLSELHGSDAARECRLALQAGLSNSSPAQDWSGRAFGAQAEHAGPLSGLKLAGDVRSAFHAAYVLDRGSAPAANDLGEFYVNAPSLVGGGTDKALSLADEIRPVLPEIAHRLRALAAEKHSDFSTAEQEFTAATAVAQAPGAYVDIANFYVRQHRLDKGIAAARRAIALDRSVDANVVEAASALSDAHQQTEAIAVLRAYLEHGRQSDQAPAFKVHTLLGQWMASQGDPSGARREFQAALALASGYAPAQKGLAAL